MLSNLAVRLKMTLTEMKIILFLLSVFGIGFLIKSTVGSDISTAVKKFDYSHQDSLFRSIGITEDSSIVSAELSNKIVDSKQEVLDFNERDFKKSKTDSAPREKSINLNTANVSDFIRLPGIGQKTAQRIIEYKNSHNGFNDLKELLNVKGIGKSKLEKIEKYIFIKKEFKPKAPEEK